MVQQVLFKRLVANRKLATVEQVIINKKTHLQNLTYESMFTTIFLQKFYLMLSDTSILPRGLLNSRTLIVIGLKKIFPFQSSKSRRSNH